MNHRISVKFGFKILTSAPQNIAIRSALFICGIMASGTILSPALAKDFLPIKQGIYVSAEVSCASPAMAYIQGYYGDSLSDGHGGCDIQKARHKGKLYFITASCLQPDKTTPTTWQSKWTIIDHQTVLIGGNKFRWCAKDGESLWGK